MQDVFHTGFVVADLDAAMPELAAALGVDWAPRQEQHLELRTPDADLDVDLRFTYSTQPHHLELVEAVPGTLWALQPEGSSTAHHIGVWSDDVASDAERLGAAGAPWLVTYRTRSGRPTGFTYHRLASGGLVELVDRSRQAVFAEWFAGGAWRPSGTA